MGRISDHFGVLYLGIAAAVYFKPEYTIHGSRIVTIAFLFTIITAYRIIYQLDLHPRFFTPLKHISTPAVSMDGHTTLSLPRMAIPADAHPGANFAEGQFQITLP